MRQLFPSFGTRSQNVTNFVTHTVVYYMAKKIPQCMIVSLSVFVTTFGIIFMISTIFCQEQ